MAVPIAVAANCAAIAPIRDPIAFENSICTFLSITPPDSYNAIRVLMKGNM
jgi:hypothetical protein